MSLAYRFHGIGAAPRERKHYSKLAYYRDTLGFDLAQHVPFTRQYRIRCSQCEALCINGTPCHESGCPNDTRECAGCCNRVPARVKYCEECR